MEPDFKEYLRFFMKRLWFIALTMVVFSGGAVVQHLFFSTPVYEANADIIVNTSRIDKDKTPVDFNQINTNLLLIDTYKEIITSAAILEAVVATHPEFRLTPEEMRKKISVSSNSRSQVMSVAVHDESPSAATRIVNAVAETFKREVVKIMNVDNVSILSEAKLTDEPRTVSLGLVFKLALAIVLSVLLSLGILLTLEFLDDTIRTEKDVLRYLGKPTLARISTIKRSQLKSEKVKKRKDKKEAAGEAIHVMVKQQA